MKVNIVAEKYIGKWGSGKSLQIWTSLQSETSRSARRQKINNHNSYIP